ncbi:MAG: hypothetical protein GQ474_01170 [Sulfurimonas sp.]|nr:hypothetical protein [Sulfurimonas sp.]
MTEEIRKLLVIGFIGAFVSAIFYLEELITDNLYDIAQIKKMGAIKVLFLLFANAIFGTVIAVTVFYGIVYYVQDVNQYFAGGASALLAFMGKDGIRVAHKMLKAKAGIKND